MFYREHGPLCSEQDDGNIPLRTDLDSISHNSSWHLKHTSLVCFSLLHQPHSAVLDSQVTPNRSFLHCKTVMILMETCVFWCLEKDITVLSFGEMIRKELMAASKCSMYSTVTKTIGGPSQLFFYSIQRKFFVNVSWITSGHYWQMDAIGQTLNWSGKKTKHCIKFTPFGINGYKLEFPPSGNGWEWKTYQTYLTYNGWPGWRWNIRYVNIRWLLFWSLRLK